jgi:uncharacterized CHY-type Zn-finger protein
MTAYQLLVVESSDLTEMTLVCPQCHTRVTVGTESRPVKGCPSCRIEFDPAAQHAQCEWQRFRSAALTSRVTIEFPVGRIRPFERDA